MVIPIDQTLARRHIYSHSRICQIFPVSLIAVERRLSNEHSTFSEKIFEGAVGQGDQRTLICKYSGSAKDISVQPTCRSYPAQLYKNISFLLLEQEQKCTADIIHFWITQYVIFLKSQFFKTWSDDNLKWFLALSNIIQNLIISTSTVFAHVLYSR